MVENEIAVRSVMCCGYPLELCPLASQLSKVDTVKTGEGNPGGDPGWKGDVSICDV